MGKYKHGLASSKIYHIWLGMRHRCNNDKCKEYMLYGGRGIKVCEEWDNDFMIFYTWSISNGYKEDSDRKSCTIDRIDPDGNYCPENCRWVDMRTQNNNRRNNRHLTHNGRTQTAAQWAREYGIPEGNLLTRLRKGWDMETALTTPKIDSVIDITGEKYGRLYVLKRVEKPEHIKSRGSYYLCLCDCGKEIVVLGHSLRSGNTTSCGCYHKEVFKRKKC